MSTIRVLIADDQDLVRGALAVLLDSEPDIEVVSQVGRGDQVLDAVRSSSVDVALLDIEMPGGTGIEAAELVRDAGLDCEVIIVTTFGRPGYLKRALSAGVRGFVVKLTPPAQLAEAVRRVDSGLRVIDPSLAQESLFSPETPLTDREIEVCRAAQDGSSVKAIACSLSLSNGTVRNHLSSVIRKTNANNRFEAVRQAQDSGWL